MRTCEFVTITIPTTYHFSPLTWCYGEGSRGGCCFCFSRPCWGYHHPLEGGNPKLRYLPWRADLVSSHMVRIGALAHCDAILGGSHVASVAWNAAPWVSFCWVIFRWAIFCVGRNHLVNGWSKRFNYAYILYIYTYGWLSVFGEVTIWMGAWKRPEVDFYRSPGRRRTWVCSPYEFWERSLIKINLSRIKH